MRTHLVRPVAWLGLVVLFAGLAACGGGSSGGGPNAAAAVTLTGDYHAIYLRYGTGVVSGTGRFTVAPGNLLEGGEIWESTGGPAVLVPTPPTLSFEVDADRTLRLVPITGEPLVGRVSETGDFAVASALASGEDPALVVLVRPAAAPTAADLFGQWWAFHGSGSSAVRFRTRFEEVHFGLSGGATTVSRRENVAGASSIVPPSTLLPFPEDHTFEPDGWIIRHSPITVIGGPDDTGRGVLSADGNVLVMGSGQGSGGAGISIYIRRTVDLTTPDLAGTYGIASFTASGSFQALGGTLELPPDGLGLLSVGVNSEGLSVPGPIVFSYEVLALPTSTVRGVVNSSLLRFGAFSSDLAFGCFAGDFDASSPPNLDVLVR